MTRIVFACSVLTLAIITASCSALDPGGDETSCNHFALPEVIPLAHASIRFEDGAPPFFSDEVANRYLNDMATCEIERYTPFGYWPCVPPLGANETMVFVFDGDPKCTRTGHWVENGVTHLKSYSCTEGRWYTPAEALIELGFVYGYEWEGHSDVHAWRCVTDPAPYLP